MRCDDCIFFFKDRYQRVREAVISTFRVKESSVLKTEVAYYPKYVCLSTKVNEVTHQTSMTLKGIVNSRIRNLVI